MLSRHGDFRFGVALLNFQKHRTGTARDATRVFHHGLRGLINAVKLSRRPSHLKNDFACVINPASSPLNSTVTPAIRNIRAAQSMPKTKPAFFGKHAIRPSAASIPKACTVTSKSGQSSLHTRSNAESDTANTADLT